MAHSALFSKMKLETPKMWQTHKCLWVDFSKMIYTQLTDDLFWRTINSLTYVFQKAVEREDNDWSSQSLLQISTKISVIQTTYTFHNPKIILWCQQVQFLHISKGINLGLGLKTPINILSLKLIFNCWWWELY